MTATEASPVKGPFARPLSPLSSSTPPPPGTALASASPSTHSAAAAGSSSSSILASSTSSSRARIYRTVAGETSTGGAKWVTREIAALDFLLGIPLEAEQSIVREGTNLQQIRGGARGADSTRRTRDELSVESESGHDDEEKQEEKLEPPAPSSSATSRWWEKWISKGELPLHFASSHGSATRGGGIIRRMSLSSLNALQEDSDLEQPHEQQIPASTPTQSDQNNKVSSHQSQENQQPIHHHHMVIAPGRRLDGRDAVLIEIPSSVEVKTRQRSIARQAAMREWELHVAHGLVSSSPVDNQGQSLLDGRVFFSSKGSYPVGVFSVLRYEPKKEEAARRRQKLEAGGGGGTQFVMPERDWRGTSYRALLPRVERQNRTFHRSLRKNRLQNDDVDTNELSDGSDSDSEHVDDDMSSSSEDSVAYVPGFLDDPEMLQGRHRHVMIGDKVTGCVVSSTIQFVKPADLKADLNKQFRERFDGWEPPKKQRKFIGARVIDGVYMLMDPTEASEHEDRFEENEKVGRRQRQGSVSSASTADAKETIRMPPSLTVSKIRSVKQQALEAAVKAELEISTLALACVYFERLCLDCRVDKSNRRLSFAACLLIAAKINESNVALVIQRRGDGEDANDKRARLHPLIRPTKKSNTMFASLLEFFTHDWSLSLKQLFSAEWGVFAALGFSLQTKPSQVAFHFKRIMKVLELDPLTYLGPEMFGQWQDCLAEEEVRREESATRRERRRDNQERKLLKLQRELHMQQENEKKQRRSSHSDVSDDEWQQQHGATQQPHGPQIDGLNTASSSKPERPGPKQGAMKLFNRFGIKRNRSVENLVDRLMSASAHEQKPHKKLSMVRSPSMPAVSVFNQSDAAIDTSLGEGDHSEEISKEMSDEGGIII